MLASQQAASRRLNVLKSKRQIFNQIFSCSLSQCGGVCLLLLAMVLSLPVEGDELPASEDSVLILHDSTGPNGWIGGLHGRLLGNLLGHFPLTPTIQAVETYSAGQIENYRATFYLGTVYSNALPASLLFDIRNTSLPFCWFKYNLWELIAGETNQFVDQFGFNFEFMDANAPDHILYKNELLTKDASDPELGRTTILNPDLAQSHALAWDTATSNAYPYVVQGGNLWYVADSPFSFLNEEDRYLAFCDLLHDIVQIDHPEQHHAIIRLEDIDPNYPTNRLYQVADELSALGIPFAVGLIPIHLDPHGVYNENQPNRVELRDRSGFLEAMQYLLRRGGQLLLHGYTHQYRDVPNPFNGLTGDDYEFFRVSVDPEGNLVEFGPVAEDSVDWVQDRLDRARDLLKFNGFTAVGWETPHYTASPLDYRVFATNFSLTFQRVLYADDQGHYAGQFFPYVIQRDLYGQYVLPENLGNVTTNSWEPLGMRNVDDLLRAARKARVVRDGWANGFFHPFLPLADLDRLVTGIQDLGFTFVSVASNTAPSVVAQSPDQHHWPGQSIQLSINATGTGPFQYQWQHQGIDLAGATNASLSLSNLQTALLGAYTIRVTNPLGDVTSYPIHVRFLETPVIKNYRLTNGVFVIDFEGAQGLRYYVDYRDFVGATSWTATFPVTGSGMATNISAPLGGLNQRFYQLRVD